MSRHLRRIAHFAAITLFAAGVWMDASAQAYPARPVRVILTAAPGSNTDFFFRAVSPRMSALLGQQLVADYRPGGGGMVGASALVKSPADGYIIALVGSGFVMHPSLIKHLPYDPTRDFTPLGLVVDVPSALVVHPTLPVHNVKDLIALARARPGELNYGSSGQGTNTHLAGVLLNLMAKVRTVHVPYKSTPPALVDLIAGQTQFSFVSMPAAVEHVRGGRLRMLAQTGRTRSKTAPDVPTMEEAALPGFYVNTGFGFVGPANVPRAAVEKLSAAQMGATRDPETSKVLLNSGADPIGSTPEAHDAFIKSEVERWKKVTREAGIQPEG